VTTPRRATRLPLFENPLSDSRPRRKHQNTVRRLKTGRQFMIRKIEMRHCSRSDARRTSRRSSKEVQSLDLRGAKKNNERNYICIYCGKSFSKGRQVLGHVVGKHTNKPRLRDTTIEVDHLNSAQRGYLAAFLDGEGGIQITRSLRKGRRYHLSLHPVVYFTNTNYEAIQTLRNWLHAGSIVLSRQRDGYQDIHVLHITGIRNILRLLTSLSPHLIIKKKHAEVLIAFCRSRLSPRGPEGRRYNSEELRLYRALRKLNLKRRGRKSRQLTDRLLKQEKSGPKLPS
jgi:hypothetical protein